MIDSGCGSVELQVVDSEESESAPGRTSKNLKLNFSVFAFIKQRTELAKHAAEFALDRIGATPSEPRRVEDVVVRTPLEEIAEALAAGIRIPAETARKCVEQLHRTSPAPTDVRDELTCLSAKLASRFKAGSVSAVPMMCGRLAFTPTFNGTVDPRCFFLHHYPVSGTHMWAPSEGSAGFPNYGDYSFEDSSNAPLTRKCFTAHMEAALRSALPADCFFHKSVETDARLTIGHPSSRVGGSTDADIPLISEWISGLLPHVTVISLHTQKLHSPVKQIITDCFLSDGLLHGSVSLDGCAFHAWYGRLLVGTDQPVLKVLAVTHHFSSLKFNASYDRLCTIVKHHVALAELCGEPIGDGVACAMYKNLYSATRESASLFSAWVSKLQNVRELERVQTMMDNGSAPEDIFDAINCHRGGKKGADIHS